MRLLPFFFTGVLGLTAAVAAQTPQPQTPPPQQPQQPATPGATHAKPPGPAGATAQRGTSTASTTLTVEVTDKTGNRVGDVHVALGGPVDRSGVTGTDGAIVFRSVRQGTYRLRFEREGFTTLERELMVRAGLPSGVSVALTAAPVVKPAPAPPPPVAVPPPTKPPSRAVEPRSLSIPDFLDRNLIGGGEPQKLTMLACAEGGTARLLQVRDPLNEEEHAEVDEMIYVVAGGGVLRIRNHQDTKIGPGFFALVPRGLAHSLRREGRNPLIVVSVFAGSPCNEPTTPTR
jgi:mannose-6-phosphate isomerase-like protein (cupin superfamily)